MAREFLLWVAAGNIAAWTAGYLFLRPWPNRFVQRIPLDPLAFLLASAAMLFVVLGAVGCQTLKAARANPVDSLRTE